MRVNQGPTKLVLAALVVLAATFVSCEPESPNVTREPSGRDAGPSNSRETQANCPGAVSWSDAARHVGQRVEVAGPVVGTAYAASSRGQPTFLNVGRPYPDRDRFTVVIWSENRAAFDGAPEVMYRGKSICVSGTVELYQGSPQIIVRSPSQIAVQ